MAANSQNRQYNVKLIDELYRHVPAFTDIFDEETWYTFVVCFVTGTIVLVFILSRFVMIKPTEW